MINGIPREVHIKILKRCGMTTKKHTRAKKIEYEKARREYINSFIDKKCVIWE